MDNELENLKTLWKDAKDGLPESQVSVEHLAKISRQKMRAASAIQLGNLLVLVATVAALSAYFYFVGHFLWTLSIMGMWLMIGSMIFRIIIEGFSVYRSRTIDLGNSIQLVNDQNLKYYNFRKTINGPVTKGVLVLYSIGFLLLMPESKEFISDLLLVALVGSYLLAIGIVWFFIKKAVNEEGRLLTSLRDLKNELS